MYKGSHCFISSLQTTLGHISISAVVEPGAQWLGPWTAALCHYSHLSGPSHLAGSQFLQLWAMRLQIEDIATSTTKKLGTFGAHLPVLKMHLPCSSQCS